MNKNKQEFDFNALSKKSKIRIAKAIGKSIRSLTCPIPYYKITKELSEYHENGKER